MRKLYISFLLFVGVAVAIGSGEITQQDTERSQSLSAFQPPAVACGNLLTRYATLPPEILSKIHFDDCQKTQGVPLGIIQARYRVNGKDALAVENYFTNTYNVSPMKWNKDCHDGRCLLSNAVFGVVFEPENIDKLYSINKELRLSFRMFGSYDAMKIRGDMEGNRDAIEQFTIEITVSLSP